MANICPARAHRSDAHDLAILNDEQRLRSLDQLSIVTQPPETVDIPRTTHELHLILVVQEPYSGQMLAGHWQLPGGEKELPVMGDARSCPSRSTRQ